MRVLALELCLALLVQPASAFITPVRYAQSRVTMRAESNDCEKRGFIEVKASLIQLFNGGTDPFHSHHLTYPPCLT